MTVFLAIFKDERLDPEAKTKIDLPNFQGIRESSSKKKLGL